MTRPRLDPIAERLTAAAFTANQLPRVLLVEDVATAFRISRASALRWCREGVVPAAQVGRKWCVLRDDLLALISDRAKRGPSAPVRVLERNEASP